MTLLAIRIPGALLALPALISAAVVSGFVHDSQNQPVAAAVTLTHRASGQTWRTVAGTSGRFSLSDLPAGDYFLNVDAPGLAAPPATHQLAAGQELDLEIPLHPERVRTEVVVTATATVQSTDSISRSLDVIRTADWEARGVSTLNDAIQQIPGVRVQSLGGPGAFNRIMARGLRGQDTAVTIDGIRFRDAATTQGDASSFLENLMLVNSERVEVLRGSGSALYGTNAIGGVVNIVTAPAADTHHAQLSGDGGGLGFGRGLLRASGPIARSLHYTAGIQHTNVSAGVDGQDPFRNTSLQAAADWKHKSGISVVARLFGADAFVGLNDSPYSAPANRLPAFGTVRAIPVSLAEQRLVESGLAATFSGANLMPNLNDPDSHRASRFAGSAFQFLHQITPRFSYRASYQNLFTRRIFEDGPSGARFEPLFRTEDWIRGQTDTLQARADVLLTNKLSVGGGYEFEREDYQSRSRSDALQPLRYSSAAGAKSNALLGYLEARLAGDRLHLSLAGRLQRFALRQPEFVGGAAAYQTLRFSAPPDARTVDAGIAYFAASTGTKFRAHAGNGYRSPSIYERFGATFFEGQFSPLGDPRLRPDRSVSLDAGLDQYLVDDRLRLTATYFYTDLREVIAFDSSGFVNPATDPFGRFGGYWNTGGAVARGFESQAEIALPRRIRSLTSYTYTNSKQRVSTVRDNDFFRSPVIVPHQVTSQLTVPIGRRLDVTASAWMVSSHANILSRRAFLFAGARRLDLAAAYRLPFESVNLRLQTRVSNALDNSYLENGFRTPGLWATAGFHLSF